MQDTSLFELYRWLLAIVVTTYILVRCASMLRTLQLDSRSADRRHRVIRRYVITLLLSVRARRYWLQFLQIGGLCVLLGYLLYLHH